MDRRKPGAVGTRVSLVLRLGQALFSTASLLFMSVGVEFYSYTAFCFLVTVMGLAIPWSFTLAIIDVYYVFLRCPLPLPGIMTIIAVGDSVLALLSLAGACASSSVVDLLQHFDTNYCPSKLCGKYQLSSAMAFLSWFLTAVSSLCNIWLVASL